MSGDTRVLLCQSRARRMVDGVETKVCNMCLLFSVLNLIDTEKNQCAFLQSKAETDVTYFLDWVETNVPNTNVYALGSTSKHIVNYMKKFCR